MDKDIHFHGADGSLTFTIHSTYYFTEGANGGTNVRRTLTDFCGPPPIAGFLPKGVVHENEICQGYLEKIKAGSFTSPEDAPRIQKMT